MCKTRECEFAGGRCRYCGADELICQIALRNLQGGFIGCIPVPSWNPNDPEDETRDLVTEAFDAYNAGAKPFQRAADWSCGTFTMGPLLGLWEWLDFGEEPGDWSPAMADATYKGILEDQQ